MTPTVGSNAPALARIGDLDNDGVDDWLLGRDLASVLASGAGSVEVRSGSTGSLISALHWTVPQSAFGRALANAGDVNGDGRDDILVGAPEYDVGQTVGGAVGVYSGGTGEGLFQLTGPENSRFGSSLCSMGDIDGDGYAEFAVAAGSDEQAGPSSGRVYVFRGSDGTVMHEAWGAAEERFGYALEAIGDLDGDGIQELLVTSAGLAAAPWFLTILSGSTFDVYRIQLAPPGSQFFGHALAAIGDVDADGLPDYAVGDYPVGHVHVYSGATGSLIRTIVGETGASFGLSLDAVEDADGDGVKDIVVGAPNHSSPSDPNSDPGAVFVYSGASGVEIVRSFGFADHAEHGATVAGTGDLSGTGGPHFLASSPGQFHVRASTLVPDLYVFCPAAANSVGAGSTIAWVGNPSVSNANLRLIARFCPPGQFGLFFFGPDDVPPTPFGDGFRCIGGHLERMAVQSASANGVFFSDILQTPSGQEHLVPGSSFSFQMWYRDPFGPGGTGFNASEALRVTFCP